MIDVSETCRISILMVDIRLFAFMRLKAREKLSGSRHMTLPGIRNIELYALVNRFL
jgi:hypothetical protein